MCVDRYHIRDLNHRFLVQEVDTLCTLNITTFNLSLRVSNKYLYLSIKIYYNITSSSKEKGSVNTSTKFKDTLLRIKLLLGWNYDHLTSSKP